MSYKFGGLLIHLHVKGNFFILLFVLVAQKGGCMIVDSTRKGKRFPDSMSKTIPIWTCVLNRAIAQFKRDFHIDDASAPQFSVRTFYFTILIG